MKLSLKRTVCGVVTSATANSCPSDKPSSASEGRNIHMLSGMSAAAGRDWGSLEYSFLLPFRVLQRFGLVRSSMDLTDYNETASIV